MSNFIWVRNPTVQNGLTTTYVSKRGSDTTGDGTAQNPYASIAYATSVATAKTNIMLDYGEWNENRTNNNRTFIFWGNSYTKLLNGFSLHYNDGYHFLELYNCNGSTAIANPVNFYFYNCKITSIYTSQNGGIYAENSILFNCQRGYYYQNRFKHCILINCTTHTNEIITNCILCNTPATTGYSATEKTDYNNYTNNSFTTGNNTNLHSINNTLTGQTVADYFNYYDSTDWTKCDFTAKAGSANIGAGEKGSTIGLNQGFAARADGTATDVFSAANGATLRNVEFSSSLNGYVLQQVNKTCAGATANTITLASDASSINDYYNGLFIGITSGTGETQIRYITDYDGSTKTATLYNNWATTPDTTSIYKISGKIDSIQKDFGEVIKVKRNFTFIDNMTALGNGEWEQFLTAKNSQNEMTPCSCYSYEYSVDGTTWRSSTELISATDGTNYVDSYTIGDASENFDEEEAEFLTLRYIVFHIHIGFNIDVTAE